MRKISEHWFVLFCHYQHDVVCNQKYNDLPYSFHLKAVQQQVTNYGHLLTREEFEQCYFAAAGHDLIEDARVTYNDIVSKIREEVADIIFACTEEKGRNRKERHSTKFYKELKLNKLGIFVKLCDIKANILFSLLTGSTMTDTYRKEFPTVKKSIYREEFNEIFEDIQNLLK